MAVCVFFQQGRCRYGDRCRNEHPGQVTAGSSANRFSALSSAPSTASTAGRPPLQQDKNISYHVTAEGIQADLTPGKDLPSWVFSSYGPGKNAPRQLFGGPSREQSFEEMRLRHYEAAASGNMNTAVEEAQKLHEEAVNQIQVILRDLNGAVKYVLDGENEHPNRNDIVEGKTSTTSAFGQPKPFGQPAAPSSTPAFGQPSGLGKPSSAPAFGQPSSLGGPKPGFGQPSAFGQPSVLGSNQPALAKPGFGQPSFGQPSFGQPSFGQPSVPGKTAFGQPSTGPPPFSQATQVNPLSEAGATPFGQPSTASPFGQPATTMSPFSQISNQPASTGGGFGQPPVLGSGGGFGQPSQQTASPFGQPQSLAQTTSPFSQAPSIAPSGFGQPPPAVPQAKPSNLPKAPLGPKPVIKVDPGELNPIPDLAGETTRDPMTQKLTRWKGRPVEYKDNHPRYLHPQDNKTWVRIFFPDGPPETATLRDCVGNDEDYTPEITEQYQFFVQNGYFKDGKFPFVPPKTEWVSFDF